LNLFGYKYIDRYNIKVSMTTKFIIGMSLGCFTMCTAGVVEIIRLTDCGLNNFSYEQIYLTFYYLF